MYRVILVEFANPKNRLPVEAEADSWRQAQRIAQERHPGYMAVDVEKIGPREN